MAPASVVAGEVFTITAPDGWQIRQQWATAQGESSSWVLVAASDDEPATARPGDDTEDVLHDAVDALEVAFDATTTAGTYTLCVTVSPADDVDATERACSPVAVDIG